MRLPYELRLAVRYLRVQRGRTFLSVITIISVAGVAVGTAALVIALALMTGFEQDMKERILRGSGDLQILDAGAPSFPEADAVAARAAAIPGVVAVAPVVYTPAMIMNEALSTPSYAEVQGIDPARQKAVVEIGAPGAALAALDAPGESGRPTVLLGEDLATHLAVRRGDAVRVLVAKVGLTPFGVIPRSVVLEVAGTFKTDAYPQDAQRAYVSIEVARKLLDSAGRASWLELKLADRNHLAAMKVDVAKAMGSGFQVLDLLDQNKAILKAFNTEKLFLFLAIALIVVVASLNIVSTLVLMVSDKVREIGTLTAMGAKPGSIAGVFMLQGLVIGLVGTAIGLVVGAAAARTLDAYRVLKLNPDVYYVDHVPFATRPGDVVVVGAAALLIAFLATIYPAWKAARLNPVEAIRHE
ncbi:MAG TPA: FtsX-like permease family protein [Candidatus Sulfotelmatobacter sp.]|jgi:lipoprotein-releasing system permease protein|nr:FtsX-like permease family protein [Candidatus Sulfotelmatobacter sp.]